MKSKDKAELTGTESQRPEENSQLKAINWLLGAKAKTGIRSPHIWIITGLFVIFTYIYYRFDVITAFHDVYVLLFFYPLIYTAVVYRLKGVVLSGLVFLGILIPHELPLALDANLLVRSIVLVTFPFLLSGLVAAQLNYLEHQVDAYEEILSLNEELNDYIERLRKTQQQLIQAAKLSALGQLSAAIAHELNNPLAGVLVYAKLLGKKIGSGNFDRDEVIINLAKIETAINYCSKIIRSLLDFARQSEPVLKPVVVSQVIDQVISLVGHQADMKKVSIIREEAASLPPVLVDFTQLQQVFINLAVNAIQATSEGGKLIIRSLPGEGGGVRVSFQDTGVGIPAENMDKLFTPFFTTKDEVKGVGLGLAVSYGIIERHGGRIDVQSEVGKGSTFTVALPAYKEEKAV